MKKYKGVEIKKRIMGGYEAVSPKDGKVYVFADMQAAKKHIDKYSNNNEA